MRITIAGLSALLLAAAMHDQPVKAAGSCESLATMAIPDATITLARTVDAGPFSPGAPAEAAEAQGRGAQPLKCAAPVLPRRRDVEAVCAIPTSRSRSGCRLRTGTENFRRSATARSTDRLRIRR